MGNIDKPTIENINHTTPETVEIPLFPLEDFTSPSEVENPENVNTEKVKFTPVVESAENDENQEEKRNDSFEGAGNKQFIQLAFWRNAKEAIKSQKKTEINGTTAIVALNEKVQGEDIEIE